MATGFYYMGARYYEPNSGRFLSADPLGHDTSLSLYDYCGGDPVNGLDPHGRCVEKGATKVGAALVTVASMTVGGAAGYEGVDYGTDQLGLTQTQNLTPAELLRHNQHISNLTEGAQGTLFAIAGAITPYNGISYEPMRFEEGAGEPAAPPASAVQSGQTEFGFARGASIQTPGVTRTGEVFVRVGVTENSTALRSGSYVMPEATFNALKQAPNMFKNAFDLPGSEPKYFRYIFPSAGTSIQRGVVPGGEFGGTGGYDEAIFPNGIN